MPKHGEESVALKAETPLGNVLDNTTWNAVCVFCRNQF